VVTREQQVEQSIQNFIRTQLTAHGYDPIVTLRDTFPSPDERAQPMTKNIVAVGFNFDDGGKIIEMGSDLTQRVYTIEFWVFGTSMSVANNVATVVRTFIEDAGYLIPLLDIADGNAAIDVLIVRDGSYGGGQGPRVQRQVSNDPRPGDRFVFSVAIRVEDTYYPSLVN
jgi:hypothetical protein